MTEPIKLLDLAVIEGDMDALRSAPDEPTLRRKGFSVLVDCRAMIAENRMLRARIVELEDALLNYATHHDSCPRDPNVECNCGFSEIIEPIGNALDESTD